MILISLVVGLRMVGSVQSEIGLVDLSSYSEAMPWLGSICGCAGSLSAIVAIESVSDSWQPLCCCCRGFIMCWSMALFCPGSSSQDSGLSGCLEWRLVLLLEFVDPVDVVLVLKRVLEVQS
ncbi:hypothetical protein Acr_15g0000830 [Actinidia rufa]|uniref:Uncharacterized protein n=1 Tax=Actinidia rufa TaxID=165716 RepID=A0A7J0FSC8_9ERIC|nr:hypothetical protein Acr_15g0000830 [Actinidia rufa]